MPSAKLEDALESAYWRAVGCLTDDSEAAIEELMRVLGRWVAAREAEDQRAVDRLKEDYAVSR